MPGICAILSLRPQPQNDAEVDLMIEAMRHEPFHRPGKYASEAAGLYVGWATLEGTFSAALPVWNEKKDCLLVFHGRHFFDKEDVTALKSRNHVIRREDASLLIHLYEEKGPDFVRELNGTFCGLVFDLAAKKGFLFNDRFGAERLYYHQSRDAVYFASEAKSLLRVLPELRALSARSLGELACCDGVCEGRTLFERVSLLPAGSRYAFEAGRVTERAAYFNPVEWEEQTLLGEDYFCGRVGELLKHVVPRYFRSEHPVAMALSGGLGARLVLGYTDLPRDKVPCYTFRSIYRDSLDVRWASSLARTAGQQHQVLKLGEEFLGAFPHHAERAVYLSEGAALAPAAAELYLAGLARRIAPVAVTGKFVAQTLKGERQWPATAPKGALFQPELNEVFNDVQARLATPERHRLSAALFQELPWLHHGRLALERSQLEMGTPFLDKDLLALLFRAPDGAIRDERLPLRLIRQCSAPFANLITDMGYARRTRRSRRTPKGACLEWLRRADRACSGTGSARPPRGRGLLGFLDLEERFLGFDTYTHFRVWFREQLAAYLKAVLLDRTSLSRSYLNAKRVEEVLRQHVSGVEDYTREISVLLTLELVHRLFLDPALPVRDIPAQEIRA